ncbi:MAG TPA: hypothetical protein VKA08_14895 [Balneolales bacterium]|nr:hypothetical protein [Balneolales bacterium]
MILRNLKLLLLFSIALMTIAASNGIIQDFHASIPDQSRTEILVQWVVSNVDEVDHFELERKLVRDASFIKLTDIQPGQQTTGSGDLKYSYIDKTIYKTSTGSEPVVYQLNIIFKDNSEQSAQAEVDYTTTAIRRTWGSIKAMFQR